MGARRGRHAKKKYEYHVFDGSQKAKKKRHHSLTMGAARTDQDQGIQRSNSGFRFPDGVFHDQISIRIEGVSAEGGITSLPINPPLDDSLIALRTI